VQDFYLPYLINYSQPVAEDIVIFCVAVLTAILVSAEGQAIVATLLGDARRGAKDRFHFNVFMHMSILGTLSFFVGGFGWAKEIAVNTRKFKRFPRFFLILSRLAGPLANLLMANIAASLAWILGKWGFEDKVFSTIVVVNVSVALYSLLPIAPLPGASVLWAIFPSGLASQIVKRIACKVGPYCIVAFFLIVRLTGWEGVSNIFNPFVLSLSTFILKF
jgi:Zn-dependent protease